MAQNWKINDSGEPYDLNQFMKRIEWLDSERRKDKDTIALLEQQIAQVQTEIKALESVVQEQRDEIAKYTTVFNRLDKLDASVSQLHIETFNAIEEKEKVRIEKEKEIDEARRNNFESLNRSTLEIRKAIEPLQDMRKSIQARVEEGFKLSQTLEEMEHKLEAFSQEREDVVRFQRNIEEGRKQDIKRLADMQNELAAYRKRSEELRGKVDLSLDNQRKVETRINDITAAENERKQTIIEFQDKQNAKDVERVKTWQDWKATFDQIIVKATSFDTQMQMIENTSRSVKRSQDSLDETTQRFDRRTNELVEMQRLAEERFRQEWSTFKDEDQKKWGNYSLGQDEIQAEADRNLKAILARLTTIEDAEASVNDQIASQNELYVNQIQELFTLVRGWLEKMDSSNKKE